jgi:hypothetical protein
MQHVAASIVEPEADAAAQDAVKHVEMISERRASRAQPESLRTTSGKWPTLDRETHFRPADD